MVEDSEYDPHLGSGVGLALVKNLILLHKGILTISSERDKGTEFLIGIPSGKKDYSEEERSQQKEMYFIPAKTPLENAAKSLIEEIDSSVDINQFEDKLKPLILIVEDNDEVRQFWVEFLKKEYATQEAVDGIDALTKINTQKPDLIVSDLMMPKMDGNKLCQNIKHNPETCHIPFIILTAKDNLEARIEGIDEGADAYLSKPVSLNLLLSTIRNLNLQRKKIKEHISSNFLSTSIEETMQMKNKDFYDQLIKTIEDNISNIDLDVDFLCRQLSCSRTKLYQQVKDISGKPIMELVRSIRLRKAVQIMAEEDISIQEIISRVGIMSQSYFTSSFKKEYNKTPSAFLKDLKAGKR